MIFRIAVVAVVLSTVAGCSSERIQSVDSSFPQYERWWR